MEPQPFEVEVGEEELGRELKRRVLQEQDERDRANNQPDSGRSSASRRRGGIETLSCVKTSPNNLTTPIVTATVTTTDSLPSRSTGQLLAKKAQAGDTEGEYVRQKGEYEARMASLQARDDALKGREEELAKAREVFRRFVSENDERLRRAQAKDQEERAELAVHEREIERLRVELEEMSKVREGKQGELDGMIRFQRYMTSVVDHSDEFADAKGVIDRWRTLTTSSTLSESSIAAKKAEIDQRQAELLKLKEDREREVLALGTLISRLKKELQELGQAVFEEQRKLEKVFGVSIERSATTAQITMACENLSLRITSQTQRQEASSIIKRRPGIQRVQDQLELVASFLLDIKDIVDGFSKQRQQDGCCDGDSQQQEAQTQEQPE